MSIDRRLFLGLVGTTAVTGLAAYPFGRDSPADAASFMADFTDIRTPKTYLGSKRARLRTHY